MVGNVFQWNLLGSGKPRVRVRQSRWTIMYDVAGCETKKCMGCRVSEDGCNPPSLMLELYDGIETVEGKSLFEAF